MCFKGLMLLHLKTQSATVWSANVTCTMSGILLSTVYHKLSFRLFGRDGSCVPQSSEKYRLIFVFCESQMFSLTPKPEFLTSFNSTNSAVRLTFLFVE